MSEAASEMDNLPEGWVKIRLGDHLELKYGKGISKKDRKPGTIPIYGSSGIIGYHNFALVKDCSIVVGRKGSAGHVQFVDRPCWPIDTTYFIDKTNIYILKFLYYLLVYLRLQNLDSSTAIPSLRRDDTYDIKIPLPPLSEQKRIISKIESIFTQVDGTRTRLEVASGMLNKLRSSVLRQAFEGKLVSQDPNDEPVEAILKRIRRASEKELVFERDNLPKGWIKANLKYLVEKIQKIDPRKTSDKIYYYCDINSIDNSKLKITNPKQIIGRNAPSRARQLIKKNDILFSTVRTYLKNIAIVPDNFHEQLASTGFCVIRSTINHKFVFYYIQSKSFLDVINKIQRGTSYPAVRNNDVLSILVPVSPLNEQRRIVGKIESIFTRINAIERYIESTLLLLDLLKSSTLKQAFEGRLVPQDPDDEPAEFLLQIVKQEKQLIKSQKSSYRRKNVR